MPHPPFPEVEPPPSVSGQYWTYILQSADSSLYVGQSNNVSERLRKHRLGLGSKYTADHPLVRLVFVEGPTTLDKAVKREAQLKRWSRQKKIALLQGDLNRLQQLAR